MHASADAVASCVFAASASLPSRGKPGPHEWTVLSGIVASEPGHALRCVTIATGTKCVGRGALRPDGLIVNDAHAEVLARRALALVLLREVRAHAATCPRSGPCALPPKSTLLSHTAGPSSALFSLRAGVGLHLYVSDSPCGRAAEYGARASGARALCGGEEGARGDDALRSKSGRADLAEAARTRSLCCSDKVARWCGVGMQSALLAHFIRSPLWLASVVVSAGEGSQRCERDSSAHDGGERGGALRARKESSNADRSGDENDVENADDEELARSQLEALTHALITRAAKNHAAAESQLPRIELTALAFPGGRAARVRAATTAAASEAVPDAVVVSAASDGAPLPQMSRKRMRAPLVGGAGSGAAIIPTSLSLVAFYGFSRVSGGAGAGAGADGGCSWSQKWETDVLIGTSGVRQGSTRSTPPLRAAPVVSKALLGSEFAAAFKSFSAWAGGASAADAGLGSYSELKLGPGAAAHQAIRRAWHSARESVFASWPCADRAAHEAFAVESAP
jgi:hypothetical protein